MSHFIRLKARRKDFSSMLLDKKKQEGLYYSKKYNPLHESPPAIKIIFILLFSVFILFGLDLYAGTHFFLLKGLSHPPMLTSRGIAKTATLRIRLTPR